MGGGLMQLVAYGAQDIYLTGNPQITFFKAVYRRHTNFSMETIQQTINGTGTAPILGTATGTVTVSRNGDLVHKVYVRAVSSGAGIHTDGNNVISKVEVEIGGQLIDRQESEWMKVWNELSTPASKWFGLKAMTGGTGVWGDSNNSPANDGVNWCHIPLQFWFCRNPGLALPLIALQYHEVKLKFTWGTIDDTTVNCTVWCDYIYLDTDERRRFAQVSHEYLIEQVQKQSGSSESSQKLNFNHPVKELIWTETTLTQTYDNKTKLQLNGHDRFSEQVQEYFILRQPYDYHTAIPGCNLPDAGKTAAVYTKKVKGFTVNTTAGNSPEYNTQYWTQPANSEITSIDIVCHTSPVVGAGCDIGYAVGTAAGGGQIVAAVTDQILDGGVTVEKNSITGPLALVDQTESGTTAPSSVLFTGTKRKVYFNITNTEDATTAGRFDFHIHWRTITTSYTGSGNGIHEANTSSFLGLINCYSFALKPEEHQPSGTCNFSRIDNAQLMFSGGTNPTVANIYAVNYNVLRIMSGMGGLAYSN